MTDNINKTKKEEHFIVKKTATKEVETYDSIIIDHTTEKGEETFFRAMIVGTYPDKEQKDHIWVGVEPYGELPEDLAEEIKKYEDQEDKVLSYIFHENEELNVIVNNISDPSYDIYLDVEQQKNKPTKKKKNMENHSTAEQTTKEEEIIMVKKIPAQNLQAFDSIIIDYQTEQKEDTFFRAMIVAITPDEQQKDFLWVGVQPYGEIPEELAQEIKENNQDDKVLSYQFHKNETLNTIIQNISDPSYDIYLNASERKKE